MNIARISDTTRIIDLTVGQLEDLTRQWMSELAQTLQAKQENRPQKRFVYGLQGLQELLKCGRTAACQLNTSGKIAAATSRFNNVIVYDADMVLELLGRAPQAAAQ